MENICSSINPDISNEPVKCGPGKVGRIEKIIIVNEKAQVSAAIAFMRLYMGSNAILITAKQAKEMQESGQIKFSQSIDTAIGISESIQKIADSIIKSIQPHYEEPRGVIPGKYQPKHKRRAR